MTVYLSGSCYVGYYTVDDNNFSLTIQKKNRIEQCLLWKPENLYFCPICLAENAQCGQENNDSISSGQPWNHIHAACFYFIYYDFLADSAHNFLARDCQLALKMMASELSVNKELIRCAFITDLDKRKIYAKFCAPQFAWLGETWMSGCLQRFYGHT